MMSTKAKVGWVLGVIFALALALFPALLMAHDPATAAAGEEVGDATREAPSWLKVIVAQTLPLVVEALGVVLLALASGLVHLVARKLKVEKVVAEAGTYELLRKIAADGAARAEHKGLVWAKDHGELPAGTQKLEWALEYAMSQAKAHGLTKVATDRLVEIIHARLGDPHAPGHEDRAEAIAMRLRGEALEQAEGGAL